MLLITYNRENARGLDLIDVLPYTTKDLGQNVFLVDSYLHKLKIFDFYQEILTFYRFLSFRLDLLDLQCWVSGLHLILSLNSNFLIFLEATLKKTCHMRARSHMCNAFNLFPTAYLFGMVHHDNII